MTTFWVILCADGEPLWAASISGDDELAEEVPDADQAFLAFRSPGAAQGFLAAHASLFGHDEMRVAPISEVREAAPEPA